MNNKPDNMPSLEDSLNEITKLIDTIEHGELTLEQSLNQFERGITLIKNCHSILEQAEQKVQILVEGQQQETLVPYGDNNKEEGPQANEDTH